MAIFPLSIRLILQGPPSLRLRLDGGHAKVLELTP